jgi:hypothetical protein
VAFPALLPLTPAGRQSLDLLLAATGLADPRPWEQLLWGWLLGLPAAFLALGLLGHVLARPGPVRGALVPLCAAGLVLFGWKATTMAGRASTRLDAAGDLADRIGAERRPSGTRTYLLFPPSSAGGPLPGAVPFMSIEGIDAGNDSPRRTWEYLQERRFKTAAAWKAFVHLHDCASLRWDSAESLRVDLANLEQHPQPIFAGLLVEKLSTCATSPENRVFLRQAAEPGRFRPDPEWLQTLAQLHHRFGDRRAALDLLSQARVEPEEAARLLADVVPLTAGTVSGRVMVNDRPGAGLTVGVVPAGRWQGLVGTPRPFEHRWVAAAASTAADGRFRLRDLGEGEYVLIVMGDPGQLPLRGPEVRAEAQPGLLRLDRRRPARDLGTIRIDTGEPSSPAQRAEIGTS